MTAMKKILVIGAGGAGKTTFAWQLGDILGIEVIHLDSLYWRPGWVEPLKDEWAATVDGMLERDAWIIDGNYSGTLERRLEACDAVVFLVLPRSICVWRVVKRLVLYHNTTRPDMADGCPELFNLKFLVWIWNYPKRTRPRIVKLLSEERNARKEIWLRTPAQIDRFLADVREMPCPRQSVARPGKKERAFQGED
jgi:adenylate kinase family enzyme